MPGAFVDPFGYPISSGSGQRLIDAAVQNNRERPSWPVYADEIHRSVSYTDWRTLLSASRRLWANYDVLKGATGQKAMHSIGRAWEPTFLGDDKDWGDVATKWLRDEWYSVCDVRGEIYDFKTSLFLDSISIDRDGDVAVLFTSTDTGYPQLQHIPANRIGQRQWTEQIVSNDVASDVTNADGTVTQVMGLYQGLRMRLGTISNHFGRTVAYRILGSLPADDRDVSARDVIIRYDPEWHDQCRGFPAFTGSINFLRDNFQSHAWEHQAQLMRSAIGLVEWNESGTADPMDPGSVLGGTGVGTSTFTQEKFDGGMLRYFKAGGGNKLEAFKSDRPGQEWDSFQDRVIRIALLGINWPYSLCWKPDGMNGTQERSEIEKARTSIKDRQDLLAPLAKREVGYAVSKAIKLGILPKYPGKDLGGQLNWSFSMPAEFSIDAGRDGQNQREDFKLGFTNLQDVWGKRGQTYDHQKERRKKETADLIDDAQALSKEKNIPFGTALTLLQQRTQTASAPGGVNGTLLGDGADGSPPAPPAKPAAPPQGATQPLNINVDVQPSQPGPAPIVNLNLTMPENKPIHKTVTPRRDADGQLHYEVVERK